MIEYEFFWGGVLSNFHPCQFVIDNIEFNSSEQAYMLMKALEFNDVENAINIIKSTHPAECKKLGRKVKDFNETYWRMICTDHMEDVCYAKFSQNSDLKDYLLSTNDKILVEASPYDCYWGIGMSDTNSNRFNKDKWLGENKLGQVLMSVRNRLKNQQ